MPNLLKNAQITWDQFKVAFKGHYILQGLMAMKHTQFMKLTQSTKTRTEYLHAFNHLSCYAPDMVDSEEKKIASFKQGLSLKLMKTLATNKSTTFNVFIIGALTQENQNNVYVASKSWKKVEDTNAAQSRTSIPNKFQVCHPTRFKPPQKKNQVDQNKKVFCKAFSVVLLKGRTGQGSSWVPRSYQPCQNCGKPDHWTTMGRCTILRWRRYLQKLSQHVNSFSINTPQSFYSILEHGIHS